MVNGHASGQQASNCSGRCIRDCWPGLAAEKRKHHSGLLQKHLDEALSRSRAADTENASNSPLKGSDRRRAKAPCLKMENEIMAR